MDNQLPEAGGSPKRIFQPREKLLFLSATVFILWMIATGVVYMAFDSKGLDLTNGFSFLSSESPVEMRNFARAALLIQHLLMFLVPGLIAAWIFYRDEWQFEVGTRPLPQANILGLGVLFLAASFPLAQTLFQANSFLVEKIGALSSLVATEDAIMNTIEGMLRMDSPWEMIFSLLVMAAVPAVGEELIFRGFIQRILERWSGKPYVAILIASLLFGLVHFEIQRLLAIIALGMVLGLLYSWTRNLWVSIIAHFLFNGIQVVAAYFAQDKLSEIAASEGESMPIYVTLISLPILFFIGKKIKDKSIAQPISNS